jgi:hypothetical protein
LLRSLQEIQPDFVEEAVEPRKEEAGSNLFLHRFVAFSATEHDEVFSGYQPGQMVER